MTPTPVFWNGDRWISERDPAHPPARPRSRRYREWILVGTLAFVLVGLAVPLGGVAAAGLSARTLIASWSAGYHVGVVQESSTRIAYRGSWTTAYQVNYLGGRAKATRTAGAKAQLRFQGSAIAWVGPIGPTRGRARVYVDGVLATTVNTYASSFHAARVLFQRSWRTVAIHRITIVDAGTAGHPTVALDAFVVRGSSLTTAPTASTQPGASAPPSAVAPTPTPTPTPAPKATPTPTPTPAPPSPADTGVYGSGIGMDSLNNTQIGGPEFISSSYRFRAATTSTLDSVRIYIVGPNHPGYGAGTGGTWQITVQTDASGAPSGTVLATTTLRPTDGLPLISWSTPATLTSGRLYHIVFRNVDARPDLNYASLDGVFMYQPTSPRQARFNDVDWGQPMRLGSGSWSDRANTIPIAAMRYGNGVTQGLGYMEVWVRSYESISGAGMARESFTVSGSSRTVTSATVRLMRISGSSPLTVRLERADGTLIEQGQIAASAIPIGIPGDHSGSGHASWATYSFAAARTLSAGQSYNLVLSAPSDTVYSIFVIRKGTSYNFPSTTFFADGHAQYTSGSGWGPFTQDAAGPLDQGDLQFYLR